MKPVIRLSVAPLVLAAAVAAHAEPIQAQTHHDPDPHHAEAAEPAIRALVAEYERAWNTHDMEAWAALYTPDSDFVNRRGGWWDSREVNTNEHAVIHEMLAGRSTAMDLEAELAAVDRLAPGVALAHVTTVWPGAATPGDRSGPPGAIMTWVVVETDEGWRIRAVQNTLVDPEPGPSTGI